MILFKFFSAKKKLTQANQVINPTIKYLKIQPIRMKQLHLRAQSKGHKQLGYSFNLMKLKKQLNLEVATTRISINMILSKFQNDQVYCIIKLYFQGLAKFKNIIDQLKYFINQFKNIVNMEQLSDYENLLDDSKFQVDQIEDLESKISTRAEILEDLLKQLHIIQQEYEYLETERIRQEVRAANIINLKLHGILVELSNENKQLRQQQKQIIKNRRIHKNQSNTPNKNDYNSNRVCNRNSLVPQQQQFRLYLAERQSFNSLKPNKENFYKTEHNRVSEIRKSMKEENSLNQLRNECLSSVKKRGKGGMFSVQNSFYLKKEQSYQECEEQENNKKVSTENIFLHFMNLMLEQQKQNQKNLYQQLQMDSKFFVKNKCLEIGDMQKMLQKSMIRIDQFLKAIQLYKQNIMNVNKENEDLQKVIREFLEAKSKIQNIYNKVRQIPLMKEQIKLKQEYIEYQSKSNNNSNCQQLDTIKMFVSLFTEDEKFVQCTLLERIKYIQNDCSNFVIDKKQGKIKQLIDSIKLGRKKFEQIYEIYCQRIKILQEKINTSNF